MQKLKIHIAEIVEEAEGITGFTLVPADGTMLPAPTPGAHIDIYLGPGLIRQYSLTNGPADRRVYRIAVKLEATSRGGSLAMHRDVRLGDELIVSGPKNNFPLSATARDHILLAGGIGITPLLSMARWLAAEDAPFRLVYFARAPRFADFAGLLSAGEWRDTVDMHYGLALDAQHALLRELLADPQPDKHL
ncbi:ferredoxin reductase [Pseudaminobacter soli (ex Li et al. 2025)]|uniref:ferredoxin reductase n=1 Tax=Pseudaminobacter soli (ex Li et al. 2025) TaxID=1295366 RepID=UPI001AECB0E6|nr:ferredoxin reductase [Mesorhizobium soli]